MLIRETESVASVKRSIFPWTPTQRSLNTFFNDSGLVLWVCFIRSQGHPEPPFTPVSPYWKLIGFQRETPLTDFRGGGILSLEHLVAFVEIHPNFILALMNDKNELK